jgi:hypothetical protein
MITILKILIALIVEIFLTVKQNSTINRITTSDHKICYGLIQPPRFIHVWIPDFNCGASRDSGNVALGAFWSHFNHCSDDWLYIVYVPLKKLSLIWRYHICRWRTAKFRYILSAYAFGRRCLYRATPAVARDLAFFQSHTKDCPI